MKKLRFTLLPALVILLVLGAGQARAESNQPGYNDASDQSGYYDASDQSDQNLLTTEELLDLLAPIALYPDPLIAQILPAATFIDQIDEAARYVREFGASARIDDQPWDVGVKSVAHYPEVLYMMDQKYDWTVSLGQAFVDQPQDVMDAIQDLRAEALALGNLVSTRQQQVIVEPGNIRIVPAMPEFIYLPVYDPQVVYLERPDLSYGLITFGAGLAIGAWLSRDCDWREHRVYYHGWREGGWVGRSRSHIRDRSGVYINQSATVININSTVVQHDTSRFRQDLRHEVERRRQLPGWQPPPPRVNHPQTEKINQIPSHRGDQVPPSRDNQQRPFATRQQLPAVTGQQRPPSNGQQRVPVTGQKPTTVPGSSEVRPSASDVFRGRDVQKVQPASRSGYGGYGSSKDATTYRERGQTSRENMRQGNRPALVQQPAKAPVPRPNLSPAPRGIAPHSQRPSVAPGSRPAVQQVPRPAAPDGRGNREQQQQRQ